VKSLKGSDDAWLDATIGFLTHETQRPDLGATTITTS